MNWRIALGSYRPRVAIFVSKYDHCLVDLLYRQRNGELACEFPLMISNHPHAQRHADFYGIPYYIFPVTQETKAQVEEQERELLESHQIDLLVLARYMQVLSPEFIAHYPQRIINIHHSFLPAFVEASRTTRRMNAGETDWSDGALRYGSAGRRADHRAGRDAHFPSRWAGRSGGEGAGPGEGRAFARGSLAH